MGNGHLSSTLSAISMVNIRNYDLNFFFFYRRPVFLRTYFSALFHRRGHPAFSLVFFFSFYRAVSVLLVSIFYAFIVFCLEFSNVVIQKVADFGVSKRLVLCYFLAYKILGSRACTWYLEVKPLRDSEVLRCSKRREV